MESKINVEVINAIIEDVNSRDESVETKRHFFMYELARFFNPRKANEIYIDKMDLII